MRITFTNFSIAFPHAEKQDKGQANQSGAPGFNTSTLTHRQAKLKMLTIIVCALMMFTISVKAQTHTMVAGTFALTGSVTYYDPGGPGGGACPSAVAGNYANNLNITETIQANPGQQIVVTFTGGLFGLSTGDFLKIYDGPTVASPLLATYTNTVNPIPNIIGASSSNTLTFLFTSDAANTCKGWQATVAAYYFMQPGNFTFACPGTYTLLDPQNASSGGPGGDATCQVSGGNTKDYQDNANITETFATGNGQCINVDPTFPNNFGICATDVLTVYDGPSILSPIAQGGAATYTNTFVNPTAFATTQSNATFQFISDGTNHARGWQIVLTCTNCPATSPNNDCANAIPLIPANVCNNVAASVSQTNSNANPFLAPTCTGVNTANDDVWFTFIANNSSQQIIVAATDGTMDPVVQLFSGTCGSFTSLYCQNATGAGGTETINAVGLTAGNTYYIRVYDAAVTSANHTFNICVVGAAPTDCVGAIHVCSTASSTHTQNNIPDYGTQEYNSSYWGCDFSGEIRSAWYYITLATSGQFDFTISGVQQGAGNYMDNDFVLWGPLGSMSCPMNTAPLRCDYSIAYYNNSLGLPHWSTGTNPGAPCACNSNSAGGLAFVNAVNGVAGQTYVLMVDIYCCNNSYNLTWMDDIAVNNQATFQSCILPIQILTFTGAHVGTDNILNWTTASETNNDYYTIERSADGENFTDLGQVNAAGTSTEILKYQYPDHVPLNGVNYYRLKQTDLDGTSTYSNTISIDNGSITPVVPFIYPNPSQGVFNIIMKAASDGDVTMQVFNTVGQLMTATQEKVQTGQNNFKLDISTFNQGVYTLVIRDNRSGMSYTNKIVKF